MLLDNPGIFAHVLCTVPDVTIVTKSLSVLICTIYPLISIPISVDTSRSNCTPLIVLPEFGESKLGMSGPVSS